MISVFSSTAATESSVITRYEGQSMGWEDTRDGVIVMCMQVMVLSHLMLSRRRPPFRSKHGNMPGPPLLPSLACACTRYPLILLPLLLARTPITYLHLTHRFHAHFRDGINIWLVDRRGLVAYPVTYPVAYPVNYPVTTSVVFSFPNSSSAVWSGDAEKKAEAVARPVNVAGACEMRGGVIRMI